MAICKSRAFSDNALIWIRICRDQLIALAYVIASLTSVDDRNSGIGALSS